VSTAWRWECSIAATPAGCGARCAGGTAKKPKALLSSVASNLARDQGRRSLVASRAAAVFANDRAAGDAAAAADQVELVLYKQILALMPDVYRDVYVLSRFAGLTYGQIAAHFGVTVKVVEWRMSQALAHCAKHLRD
jgi:DNA-directed RNA polymerase specialized sigma24 family protein